MKIFTTPDNLKYKDDFIEINENQLVIERLLTKQNLQINIEDFVGFEKESVKIYNIFYRTPTNETIIVTNFYNIGLLDLDIFFDEVMKIKQKNESIKRGNVYPGEELLYVPGLSIFDSGVGHPLYPMTKRFLNVPGRPYITDITSSSIKIITASEVFSLPFSDIEGIYFETHDQLKDRLTVTRWVLWGVFSLMISKKEKYLTIDFRQNKSNITMAFSTRKKGFLNPFDGDEVFRHIYKIWNNSAQNNSKNLEIDISDNSLKQLKNLKELVDLGIVTQEEFDKKKKELLGL